MNKPAAEPSVKVENLKLSIVGKKAEIPILDDISLQVDQGHVLGIAGESGAGKSMTVYAIAGLLSGKKTRQTGSIFVCGTDILTLPESVRQSFCASNISFIPQDSIHALNPYEPIGKQMYRVASFRGKCSRADRRAYLEGRLEQFGINNGSEVLSMYPHQLSGGMRQRIAISMALEADTKILIADEPTTSLDVIHQARFLEFLKKTWEERRMTVIYVSHDIPLLGNICDELLIMKDGRCVEHGTRNDVLYEPKHSYTRKLMDEARKISE